MAPKFSSYTNKQFSEELIGTDVLDKAVEFIRDNLTIEEVYDKEDLEEWAHDNGYVKEE